MKRLVICLNLILILVSGLVIKPKIIEAKDTYPKLANYYLRFFKANDYATLAKWDLLVIQAEMTSYNPGFFSYYRRQKPEGILLPYIYPAMFYEEPSGSYQGLEMRKYVYDNINQGNWWLRDTCNNKVYSWPQVAVVNVTNKDWQNFMASFVSSKLDMSTWDGVMYDMVDSEIGHYYHANSCSLDIDGSHQNQSISYVNQRWREGMAQLFSKTRQALGDNKIIIGNGNSLDLYQRNINGRIFENFPTPWEGNGSWTASMYQYLQNLPTKNKAPQIYIINDTTMNTGHYDDYKRLRFGLASALLGDGYFSFDYGDQSHQQTYWYDEYDVNLGRSDSSYFNLLEPNNKTIKPGLWRRDFENGIALVNSTKDKQVFVFSKEQFEKINGSQDHKVNDGTKVNYVNLGANDGIILRKIKQDISGQEFYNGIFARVYDINGQQVRNGLFLYRASIPSRASVILDDINNDGQLDKIVGNNGSISISISGGRTISFKPYDKKFTGQLALSLYDFNHDGNQELVVAPRTGGGPNIKVFNLKGQPVTKGFMAYGKDFHGGVNLAVGDINNDGQGEIIASPANNSTPFVKIFTEQGNLVGSFMAYDKKYLGGVSLAVGDVNNDGLLEIVTGSAHGGTHVRIFNQNFSLLAQYMAFNITDNSGINVMVADVNGDGKNEILAGTTSF